MDPSQSFSTSSPVSPYYKASLVSVLPLLPPLESRIAAKSKRQYIIDKYGSSGNHELESKYNLPSVVLAQSLIRMWIVKRRFHAMSKNFRIRCEVVKEILTSEKRYNKQLHTMVQVFLVPLREAIEERYESSDSSSSESGESNSEETSSGSDSESESEEDKEDDIGCTEDDIFQIFSHLETILNLSNVLISLLEEKYAHGWRSHRTLGDVFIQIGPFLKTLKQYVENYDNALATLTRLKEESEKFEDLIEEMEDDPRCQSLDLGSLLIVPVQRVPRYILLLDTLQKNTPSDHPDHPLLGQAIEELKRVAAFINKGIGTDHDIGVLAYLQTLADARGEDVELIQTHRKMIKYGVLNKKSLRDNNCTSRELYLLTDLLVVVGDIMNVVSLRRIDKIVPLITTTVVDNNISGSDPTSFLIVSPIKTFQFVCGDIDMKLDWMSAIQTTISELIRAHPNNIKLRQEWSLNFKNNQWQVTRVEKREEEQESNTQKGLAQLAQLQKLLTLSNKGKIKIKKACIGLVEEISGSCIAVKDQCTHFSGAGTFLVFPPSEKVLWLIPLTGFITIANKGGVQARLCSHRRGCGSEHNNKHRVGKIYDLLSGETKRFPFRGNWAIEVLSGDCAELQIVSFSTSHGDTLPNLLGMGQN